MRLRLVLLIAVLGLGGAAAFLLSRGAPVEKRGPSPPPSVAAVLPGDADRVAAAIGASFNRWSDMIRGLEHPHDPAAVFTNKFPYRTQWSGFFLFAPDERGFPADADLRREAVADSAVAAYLALPPQRRARDFYLQEPSGEQWWESEYVQGGVPVKFRCAFLIHLEAADAGATRVEIIEHEPLIWAGERWGFSPHALPIPTRLHDIRAVEATTADRATVLRMIGDTLRRGGS